MKTILTTKNLILLLLSVFLFLSCKNKTDNAIRIGILQGPTAVSFVHMMADPPKIEGKSIKFIVKNDPQQIQALMVNNELDFAVLPTVMAANLYNKGLKYRMVACPIWGTLYLVSNSNTTTGIGDLSGKTIGVFGQGATPDILLQHFLEKNNIDNVKLDYTFTNNSDLSMALLSKRIKIAVISEPLVSTVLSKDKSLHIISKLDFNEFIENADKDIFVQTAFLANYDFALEYPTTMHLICEAYSASCNNVNEQPEKTAELLVKQAILTDKNVALASLPLCNVRYVASFAIESEINKYLEIFKEFNPKTIGNKLPDRNFIYQPQ